MSGLCEEGLTEGAPKQAQRLLLVAVMQQEGEGDSLVQGVHKGDVGQ
jgi:hypothetical protein